MKSEHYGNQLGNYCVIQARGDAGLDASGSRGSGEVELRGFAENY